MGFGSRLRSAFMAVAIAIPALGMTALTTSDAQAVEAGFCAAPQEMMTKLQQDVGGDVYTLATMNWRGVDVDTNDSDVRRAQVVMSSGDFSQWYVIRGNAPLGEASTELCISLAGRDLEVNDYRVDRDPTVTRYTFNAEAAREQCEAIEAGIGSNVACGERSAALEGFAEDHNGGQHLAFQGIETLESGDDGVLWSLIADPDDADFRTLGSLDQGATIVGGSGDGFSITAVLQDYFSRPPQVAAVEPGPAPAAGG